ncbi:hypothetical protein JL722_1445 [Aureococcus anophagefferens]|nr:hypothetical protein JL722_1445 [Aureococcus anophagefferens]
MPSKRLNIAVSLLDGALLIPAAVCAVSRLFSVALAETIEKEFTGQVTVTQVGDPGTTGNFEVTVAGKLVHSKTTMGHDKCQSGESTQKVIDAIQEAVDA